VRLEPLIFFTKNRRFAKFRCRIDNGAMIFDKSKTLNSGEIKIGTGLYSDCFSRVGKYKIKLFLSYKITGENKTKKIGSNWFYIVVI
jgi:hypothetical protein